MRKKDIGRSCTDFSDGIENILYFLDYYLDYVAKKREDPPSDTKKLSKLYAHWVYDYAIIRLYREFETFMLDCLTALINNDTKALSDSTGYKFPKHLTDEVCKFLIIGNGYFDFKGRDGLIKTLKKYLPEDHWFIGLIKQTKYKESLDQLSALRNYATHESNVSKKML